MSQREDHWTMVRLMEQVEELQSQLLTKDERIAQLEQAFNSIAVMKLYDEKLKAHPHYKRLIAHTPFENDCAVIAWNVIQELQALATGKDEK